MESERLELQKSLVDDIVKGMEQVEQLKASSPSRQRMLTSYQEALFILTGRRDPRGQCLPVISPSDPPPPAGSSWSLKRKSREDVTSVQETLDDGYKWRKYGTKEIVRGSIFPSRRDYYKCQQMGCSARKHTQRSSIDPTKFEITYSGRHKHACVAGGGGGGGASAQALRKEDGVAGHELKNMEQETILVESVEHVSDVYD